MATIAARYNAKLTSHPYTTKATTSAVTYFAADLTAQSIENEDLTFGERASRAVKFAAVGGLWTGPLLTKWFFVMDRWIPGRGPAAVAKKLVLDQLLQGPFMIGSMFALCAFSNGAAVADVEAKLDAELVPVWLRSVVVWGPVQVVQQAFVPIQYRVAVANSVSYFWDTYLSLAMMAAPADAEAGAARPATAPLRRFDTDVAAAVSPMHLTRRSTLPGNVAPVRRVVAASPKEAAAAAARRPPADRRRGL